MLRKHLMQHQPDDIIKKHDIVLVLACGQEQKPRQLGRWNADQGELFGLLLFRELAAEPDDKIQCTILQKQCLLVRAEKMWTDGRKNLRSAVLQYELFLGFLELRFTDYENPLPVQFPLDTRPEKIAELLLLHCHCFEQSCKQLVRLDIEFLLRFLFEALQRTERGNPYPEKLIEVRGPDCHELDPFVQRNGRIGRLLQHAMVERQPAQVTILQTQVIGFHKHSQALLFRWIFFKQRLNGFVDQFFGRVPFTQYPFGDAPPHEFTRPRINQVNYNSSLGVPVNMRAGCPPLSPPSITVAIPLDIDPLACAAVECHKHIGPLIGVLDTFLSEFPLNSRLNTPSGELTVHERGSAIARVVPPGPVKC